MSYLLHVWETPVPESLAGAARAAIDRGGEVVGRSPGFLVLAGRLRARYPGLSHDRSGSIWSDAPPDGSTDQRSWSLGVGGDLARVTRFIVRQANLLGLCVLDIQQGIAWLPGGAVLAMSGPTAAGVPLSALAGDDRLTKTRVHGELRRLLHRVFTPLGYQRRDSLDGEACRLTLPDGFIDIGVAIWDHHSSCSFSLFCSIRHARCADLVESFEDVGAQYRGQRACAIIHLGDVHPERIDRIEVDGLRRFHIELDSLETLLRAQFEPLLVQCRTLEGLEAYVNRAARVRSARHANVHYMDDIVLAWLVGNPAWERIGAECSAALPPRAGELRERIERLLAHLRVTDPAQDR